MAQDLDDLDAGDAKAVADIALERCCSRTTRRAHQQDVARTLLGGQ